MAYSFKLNNILKGGVSYVETPLNSSEFINRANETTMLKQQGIIESLYVINDSVFAIIRKNTDYVMSASGDLVDHGDSLFNMSDGFSEEDMTVSELAIPINIDASNNKLERYIQKECIVTVNNGVAVSAKVNLGYKNISTIPASFIRKTRLALAGKTNDLFSDIGKKYFKEKGYTDEDIEALSDFKYVQEMTGKLNTVEGEALWFKDTNNKSKDENILKANPLLLGLNKLNMKSKTCHIPSRIFSGK